VAKSCLPMLIIGWRSDGHGSFPGLVLFRLVAPPLQLGVVGSFPDTGCMVLQPFAAGGNRSYQEFWAVTGGRRYLGYLPQQLHILRPSLQMLEMERLSRSSVTY
jgi:hypothetical protein